MTSLRRILWRYQAHQIPHGEVSFAFEKEISRILEEYHATVFQIGEVRSGSRELELCITLDNAVNSARGQVRGRNFKTALHGLKRAETAWKVLELCHAARGQIQGAEEVCGKLFTVLGSETVQSFAICETVRRLLATARQLYDAGKLRQARFVAAMCRQEAKRLLRVQEAGEEEMQAMRKQVEKLCALQQALAQVPFRNEERLVTDAIAQAEMLMAKGHMLLAKYMLDELKTTVAPRATFLEELTRQLGPPELRGREPVLCLLAECGISPQDTWESATSNLLERALTRLEAKVKALSKIASERSEGSRAVSA
jgi:hypothetical protein